MRRAARTIGSLAAGVVATALLATLMTVLGPVPGSVPGAIAAGMRGTDVSSADVSSADVSSTDVSGTDVNDFTIESFDAEYRLGRDGEGRSTLHTVERITAVFPDFDQNRGLIRDLVRVYDGHETDIEVRSVTDERGNPRPFETEQYGDFLSVIMAVPEGSYVHGAQTYVVEYAQRDVTRFFENTGTGSAGTDEFYWDVNGTDWSQPFGRVSARLTLEGDLAEAFTGDAACYRGRFGSNAGCEVTAEGRALVVDERDLGPYENVTIAAGFEPGTFSPRPAPFLERFPFLVWGGLASLAAAVALGVTAAIRARRGSRTGRAIIAQYEPPAGMPVAVAAVLLRAKDRAMTATLLDLAVRRRIRLLHDEPSGLYGAQLIDEEGLAPIERTMCDRVFAKGLGSSLWFDGKSTRLGDAATALTGQAEREARSAGLTRRASGKATGTVVLLLVLALALPVLHSILTGDFVLMTVLLAVGINLLVWVIIGAVAALLALRTLTPAGALLRDHLMGLREYIRLAEADRIRVLQSASGAEVDEHRIVQVHERLLPYAVLFGYEREWQAELARLYRESTPEWVAGSSSTSFSHAISIAALTSSVSSSPVTRVSSGSGSGSSFSSSGGGSSGGGFSGGGGGGGGGRGI